MQFNNLLLEAWLYFSVLFLPPILAGCVNGEFDTIFNRVLNPESEIEIDGELPATSTGIIFLEKIEIKSDLGIFH